MNTVNFVSGQKKTRGELRLPQQHFIAMDDWINKLGTEAYIAWLKFYTFVNRKDNDKSAIPTSMNQVIKRIGSNKKAFYQKVIRPLWNYGFIDLEEVHITNNSGSTVSAVNIIVYEYPQNDVTLATKPLEQIRDYDSQYQTKAREDAKKGGRKPGGFPQKPGVEWFPTETGGGFPQKPGVVSEGNPNNVLEKDLNVSNESNESNDRLIDSTALKFYLDSNPENLKEEHIEPITLQYALHRNRPGFSDALFVQKLEKTLKHYKSDFVGYLHKSLDAELTQIEQQPAAPIRQPRRSAGRKPTLDMAKGVKQELTDEERAALRAKAARLDAERANAAVPEVSPASDDIPF